MFWKRKGPPESVTPRFGPSDFSSSTLDSADLINRPTKRIDQRAARRLVQGKRILITGAGGTIGSELVRQALEFAPAEVFLVDSAEFNLYEIDLELREAESDVKRV